MSSIIRFSKVAIFTVVIAIFGIVSYYSYNLPDTYYVTKGDTLKINTTFNIKSSPKNSIEFSSKTNNTINAKKSVLKLFGVIPIKQVTTMTVDAPVLVPGGQPFGIKILSDGVMVVGVGEVETASGYRSPADESGIKVGDVIISINDEKVISNQNISQIITKSKGRSVEVKLSRQNREMTISMKPAYSLADESYKAGIWVRDSSAGIGTVTFYDPSTNKFGGLGHPVCDVDTGEIIPLSSGEVVDVRINGYNKSYSGQPGELLGSFTSNNAIGTLDLNNQSGLFGELNNAPSPKTIEMGFRQDIEVGDATILTTIEGSTPKEYNIQIEKVDLKSSELSKNMVIKITDKELLDQTGGILQGMSGSPIIQNGKLVGAVTHVFVNDPTKGFGIFADTMYDYTIQLDKNEQQLAS